jgi:hypothetical protein
MRRTLTWPEGVRYFAIFLWVMVLFFPIALCGGFSPLAWPDGFEWHGAKPKPPSRSLAIFWCLSLIGFLIAIALCWQYGGAWVILLVNALTVFGIAQLLLVLGTDFETNPSNRRADADRGQG